MSGEFDVIDAMRRAVEIIKAGVDVPARHGAKRLPAETNIRFTWGRETDAPFYGDLRYSSDRRDYSLAVTIQSGKETVAFVSGPLGDLVARRYLADHERASHLAQAVEFRR